MNVWHTWKLVDIKNVLKLNWIQIVRVKLVVVSRCCNALNICLSTGKKQIIEETITCLRDVSFRCCCCCFRFAGRKYFYGSIDWTHNSWNVKGTIGHNAVFRCTSKIAYMQDVRSVFVKCFDFVFKVSKTHLTVILMGNI